MASNSQPGTALKRLIGDGMAYDVLFPRATGRTDTIKRNADLEDTLGKLPEVVRDHDRQCEKLARRLQGRSRRECAANIWEFCYGNIQYERDEEGTEQIRTPARSWHDRKRGIDCDCFSVLVSCTLRRMHDPQTGKSGIPHLFRVVKYHDPDEPNPPYSHIYVVVPNGKSEIIIDPVAGAFDYEEPFIQKRELKMELQVLNGPNPGAGPPGPLGGIDQMDIFGNGYPGLSGKEELKNRPLPEPTHTNKLDRIQQEAAAHGMTVEQYQAYQRQEFIKKYGMTPEQWSAQVKNNIATAQQAAEQREAEEKARIMRELDKRGAAYNRNATKQELLDLLRQTEKAGVGGQIANAINKVNPATVLLRTGVLLLLKNNFLQISEKLRYGFLSDSQAQAKGLDRTKHAQLKKVNDKLRKIFFAAGGKPEDYKDAILQGKGNQDRDIALAGFSSGYTGALHGLGEPVSATAAIAAATATMTAIAALLKSIGNVKNGRPSDPAPNERNGNAGNPQGQSKAEQVLTNLTNLSTAAGGALETFDKIRTNTDRETSDLPGADESGDFTGDSNLDTNGKETGGEQSGNGSRDRDPGGKSDKLIKGLMIGGGVLAAAGITYLLIPKGKKKAGLAGKPTAKTKTTSQKGSQRKRPGRKTTSTATLKPNKIP